MNPACRGCGQPLHTGRSVQEGLCAGCRLRARRDTDPDRSPYADAICRGVK